VSPEETIDEPGHQQLGRRLRVIRKQRGMTLRELGRRVNVSASLISQIELGKVNPSVATLYGLVDGLGTTMEELLVGAEVVTGRRTGPGSGSSMDNVMRLMGASGAPLLQREPDRKIIELGSGVRWERLTGVSVPGVDFLQSVYEPGAESCAEGTFQRHGGHEWGHLLSGELHLIIDFGRPTEYVMQPGDSISFGSTLPHRIFNPGAVTAVGIWFVLGRSAATRPSLEPVLSRQALSSS
jgi:DNA-binding XRE family transcriptional regulator